MQNLNISLVQANQVWEDKVANFVLYDELLKDITDAHLILLPEMFQTAFSMNTHLAEDAEKSKSIDWLKNQAHRKNAAIYTSLMIKSEKHTYNRGVFVEPSGKTTFYDKRKTFTLAKENDYFAAGDTSVILNYLGWKIQLQICYDLRFPEIVRNTWDSTNALAAYDVLLFVANWPAKRGEHWRTLLKARAIENQCFVAGVNRVGKDKKDLDYTGDSMVYNALGEALIASSNEQCALNCVLDSAHLKQVRKDLPFLADQDLK